MPTYLNTVRDSYATFRDGGGPNCRQIYEHVQGCPVCQQLFGVPVGKQYHVMQQQRPPFVADPNDHPNLYASSGDTNDTNMIKISPTIVFLVVLLIVILLVYIIRNCTKIS